MHLPFEKSGLAAMNAWKMNLAESTAEDTSKILALYAKDGQCQRKLT